MTETSVVRTSRAWRSRMLPLLVLPAVLVLSACGGGGTSSAGGPAEGGDPQTLEGQCGDVPVLEPNDPEGLVAGLSEEIQTAFNGWPDLVQASAWSDLESKVAEGPVTVGYLQQDSGSPVAAALAAELNAQFEASKAAGEVESLIVETPGGTGGQVTAADQVRAFEQLVNKGADIIIAQPLSGEALVGAVNSAGEQGIPTVTFTGYVESPYALNITPNAFDGVAQAVAKGAEMVGGEGNAVIVQGIEGMSVSTASVEAAEQTLSLCPEMTIVGTPAGDFNDPAAKSAMVSFLASHPEQIDLVYQVASMGAGVFAGFEDAGRDDQPLIVDNLPTAASLAWWDQKRADGYEGLAVAGTGAQFAEALWDVAMRTMKGEKPAINQIALQVQFITEDNVDEYIVPGEGVTSTAETQTVGTLLPEDYLDGYFTAAGQ